nr:sulfotransferase [Saprospiraceae bacterium]
TAKIAWTPLLGAGFTLSRSLLRQNEVRWTRHNWLRRMMLLSMTELDLGLKMWEGIKYGKQIAETTPSSGPFFIVGYWRSGTTYLHTLLAQDKRFGCLTLDQTIAPRQFLVDNPIRKSLLNRFGPQARPIDGVPLGADLPQEDEFALSNLTDLSCYHGLYFPSNFERYYLNHLDIESLPVPLQQEWMAKVRYLYAKLTLKYKDRPLLLKNPPHTARIGLLKSMFPQAKFIYLLRRPEQVYASAVEFKSALLRLLSFQEFNEEAQLDYSRQAYPLVMNKVAPALAAMNSSDYLVIRYEDLVEKPLKVCRAIYQHFELGLQPEECFTAYINRQSRVDNSSRRNTQLAPKWLAKEWQPLYDQHIQWAAQI